MLVIDEGETPGKRSSHARAVRQTDALFRLRGGLRIAVTGLDLSRRVSDVFFVHLAQPLLEQPWAGVSAVNKYSGNQTSVTIDCMRKPNT